MLYSATFKLHILSYIHTKPRLWKVIYEFSISVMNPYSWCFLEFSCSLWVKSIIDWSILRLNKIPVPKQRPVQDMNNHLRPISLTPIVSKIAEDYLSFNIEL